MAGREDELSFQQFNHVLKVFRGLKRMTHESIFQVANAEIDKPWI